MISVAPNMSGGRIGAIVNKDVFYAEGIIKAYMKGKVMNSIAEIDKVHHILSDMDKLISEILQLRRRVALLAENGQTQSSSSVRDAEWFGMWADREDMQGLLSREWLTQLRNQQWTR